MGSSYTDVRPLESVKRIYLDQWVWVKLARAALGRLDDRDVLDALEVARFAVANGLADFPLSAVHYMELTSGANPRQRRDLATVILELSHGHTMVSSGIPILEGELDESLYRRFGRPRERRTAQIFGVGVMHAMGREPLAGRIVGKDGGPAPMDAGQRRFLEEKLTALAEVLLLTGPAEGVVVPGYDPRAHLVVNDRWVSEQEAFAEKLRQLPANKRDDAHFARAWVLELLPLLPEALRRARLPWSAIPDTKEELIAILQDLPTLWAWTELTRLQHQNPTRAWRPQDFNDLRALTVAIVHCDIVVFEKHWSNLARRAHLDVLNGTTLTRLEHLVTHLVES
jgi:hypothetical protein